MPRKRGLNRWKQLEKARGVNVSQESGNEVDENDMPDANDAEPEINAIGNGGEWQCRICILCAG